MRFAKYWLHADFDTVYIQILFVVKKNIQLFQNSQKSRRVVRYILKIFSVHFKIF